MPPNSLPDQRLSPEEAVFVMNVATTYMTPTAAARIAWPHVTQPSVKANQAMKKPTVQVAIAHERAKYEAASDITRRKVIDGFKEAIDMARVQADPTAMIGGWREIAKVCGHYEPTKQELIITFRGERTLRQMEQMTDEQLLKLAHQEIQGEFTEVPALPAPEDEKA